MSPADAFIITLTLTIFIGVPYGFYRWHTWARRTKHWSGVITTFILFMTIGWLAYGFVDGLFDKDTHDHR